MDNTFIAITNLCQRIFKNNFAVGWWTEEDLTHLERPLGDKFSKQGALIISSKIALCHSELSEGLEGMRKNLMDDHLPHRPQLDVELADTVIRVFDLAGALGIDLGGVIQEKLEYNAQRADHKLENRAKTGGKTI